MKSIRIACQDLFCHKMLKGKPVEMANKGDLSNFEPDYWFKLFKFLCH